MENRYPSNVWKHCPYCGDTSIRWEQGTHKMCCTACGRTFYINAAGAVIALIRNAAGDFLFTRRRNAPAAGTLDFPGGFVNLGERAEDAVVREVREELNLRLSKVQYYTSMTNRYLFGDIVYFTLDLVFICEYDSLDNLAAADDVSDFMFLNINTVATDDLGLESVKKLVEQLKNEMT